MKKLLSILLALSLTLSLAACGDKDDNKAKETDKKQETKVDKDSKSDKDDDKDEKKSKKVDIDDAVWEGYDNMPLTDLIDEAIGSMGSFGIDYKVSTKQGWSKSKELDDGDLSKGLEPYTYTITLEYDGMTETMYLFMALDEDGVLTAHGAATTEDGDFEEYDASDAEDFIQDFVDMVESDYDYGDYDDDYYGYDDDEDFDDYDFENEYDFDDFDYDEFDFEDYDY